MDGNRIIKQSLMIRPKKMCQIPGMLKKFNLTKKTKSQITGMLVNTIMNLGKTAGHTHMFLRMLIVKVRIAATGLESNER